MKKKKKKVTFQVDDIICDVCGTSCKKNFDIESATLYARWGYDSKKDGELYQIDLCEDCFDRTIEYLKKMCKNNTCNLSPKVQ